MRIAKMFGVLSVLAVVGCSGGGGFDDAQTASLQSSATLEEAARLGRGMTAPVQRSVAGRKSRVTIGKNLELRVRAGGAVRRTYTTPVRSTAGIETFASEDGSDILVANKIGEGFGGDLRFEPHHVFGLFGPKVTQPTSSAHPCRR